MKLSQNEQDALDWLKRQGGTVSTAKVPSRNERFLGELIPGMGMFKKLQKIGLVVITEEEPIQFEDGSWFEFTSTVDLVTPVTD